MAKPNVGQQSSVQVALILDHWIIGTVFLILHLLLKINALYLKPLSHLTNFKRSKVSREVQPKYGFCHNDF